MAACPSYLPIAPGFRDSQSHAEVSLPIVKGVLDAPPHTPTLSVGSHVSPCLPPLVQVDSEQLRTGHTQTKL